MTVAASIQTRYLEIACPLPLQKVFDYQLPSQYVHLLDEDLLGRRVKIQFGHRPLVGCITRVKSQTNTDPASIKPVQEILDSQPILSAKQMELGAWLANRYLCSLGEALFFLMPPGRENPTSFKDPGHDESTEAILGSPHEADYELTKDQKSAEEKIHEGIYSHEPHHYLIHGVAAAGKTEVYFSAIKDVLAQHRPVLVLVPEIGLGMQMTKDLKSRFGEEQVLFWHSNVPLKKRIQDWWRIKRGEYPIVVGARSAVLAPLPDVGLIVVDEEHDSSYKEDRKPRFHVRDVAYFRAHQHRAVSIFGSATPSLEAMGMGFREDCEVIELKERVTRASAPHIRLIDTSQERYKGSISLSLQRAMEEQFKKKEQTILFINKRGYFRYCKCPKCDWVAKCDKCQITLVEHKKGKKDEGAYQCHYCALIVPAPSKCPECGQKKLFAGGYGTQRVVDDVKARFPWAKVLRWDRDATSKLGNQKKVYEEFIRGDYDVLVGTQMVAQGFNFPNVTLVGVMEADGPLHLPDFRAAEKTFQILMQVSGRAGRAMVTGDVLIQTRHSDHYALKKAVAMDYLGFVEQELQYRHDFRYPPFTHLIKFQTNTRLAKNQEKDEKAIESLLKAMPEAWDVAYLGPLPSKRAKKGIPQSQFICKVPEERLLEVLSHIQQFLRESGPKIIVDVDPE